MCCLSYFQGFLQSRLNGLLVPRVLKISTSQPLINIILLSISGGTRSPKSRLNSGSVTVPIATKKAPTQFSLDLMGLLAPGELDESAGS